MGDYYTQECFDQKNLTVQILLKRVEDYSKILQYYDETVDQAADSQASGVAKKPTVNLYAKAFLYVDENRISRIYQTPIKNEELIEMVIEFEEQLNLLPYTTFLAFSVFSCDRSDEVPIASTTMPLYNENLEMRQGQYSLFLWPESFPDIRFETTTPGLIKDSIFETINTNHKKYMKLLKQWDDPLKRKDNLASGMDKLSTKSHILSKSVPFAFLIVELPDCQGRTVYYGAMPRKIAGSTFDNNMNMSRVFDSEDTAKFFIQPDYVNTNLIVRDFEHDFRRDNTILSMYFRSTTDEGDPRSFKPNKMEAQRLEEILKKPNFALLDPKEKNYVWKFRYYIKDRPEALTKVLKSEYYKEPNEIAELISLIQEWAKINYDDAIYLLSGDFALNNFTGLKSFNPTKDIINTHIRKYAVSVLLEVDTEKIDFIFLQLVSALRYEKVTESADNSPLLQFMLEKACQHKKLSNVFYWHICVECESDIPEIKVWYELIREKYLARLQVQNPQLYANIHTHMAMRKVIQTLTKEIKKSGNAESRTTNLRKKLKEDKGLVRQLEGKIEGEEPSLFILNPNKILDKLDFEKVRVFRSNTSPFLMTYKTKDGGHYNLIYKDGDDLRTDVLIMQMIYLMDTLMKSLNVDLKLTVYQVLAYGSTDGIMECVDYSKTVQELLKDYKNKLYNYLLEMTLEKAQKDNPELKTLQPRADVKLGTWKEGKDAEMIGAIERIDPVIMNNYIESLAGYCVITYLLGIGDRHLENLMIDRNGKLFHIDFGYAMGEDPKWNPPLFKLTVEMINAMGGKESENYTYFENKCVTYFITLRKHSKLLLNLMHLMVDSNIVVNPKKGIPLKRESMELLAQRLILNENEKKAEIYFKKLMKECINSNLGVLYDKVHVIAGYFG